MEQLVSHYLRPNHATPPYIPHPRPGTEPSVIIIALVLLVLVAWIEHLGAKGMIGRILLKGQGRLYVPKRNKLVEAQDVAIKV